MPKSTDALDQEMYELAKSVFVARLQKYGLWHPDYKAMKVICRGKRNKPRPPC